MPPREGPTAPFLEGFVAELYREVRTLLPESTVLARVALSELGRGRKGSVDVLVLDRGSRPRLCILADAGAARRARVAKAVAPATVLAVAEGDYRKDPIAALTRPLIASLDQAPDDPELDHPTWFLGRGREHPRTGLLDLDRKLGPLEPGELIVVGGVTGVGKSSFLRHLAIENAIERALPTLYVSLESSIERLALDIVTAATRIEGRRLATGSLTAEERAAVDGMSERLRASPLLLVSRPDMTAAYLEGLIDNHAAGPTPPRLVLVDYLELMEDAQRDAVPPMLKRVARRHHLPVVLVTNSITARRIQKPDGRSSMIDLDALGPHADKVLLLHREEVYELSADNAYIAEIAIAKNRGGPKSVVSIAYFEESQRFQDLEVSYEENPS